MVEFPEYLIHKLLKNLKIAIKKQDLIKIISTLVTRGNVAIYCYNALTAKTWGVSESTGSELTSKASKEDTILAKYFSDFVNEAGDMKLVEGAEVTATAVNDTELGANQIKLDATYAEFEGKATGTNPYYLANFIEAKSNVKNKTEKTYATSTNNVVVAYVAEDACDNLASLKGKKVDVIFGKNNEVAYIAVTDDTVDGSFVTAWNVGKANVVDGVIEIDGVEYDIDADETVKVTVFGETLYVAADSDADELIDAVVAKLGVKSAKRDFDRNLKADVILDEDGEVKKVDFTFSGNVTGLKVGNATENKDLYVLEGVVEKVTSSDKVVMIDGAISIIHNQEIDEDIRVVKNGEIATAEDIEAGDVLTVIGAGSQAMSTIKTIIASNNVVEGTVDGIQNKTLTINSEDYYTSRTIIGNADGELDEATDGIDLTEYYEYDVTVYLNFLGEVVAMVGETEATDVTIGMIVKTNDLSKTDESKDVDYVSVRILTADGSKATYKIYMKDEDDAVETYAAAFLGDTNVGKLVVFSADADRVITLDQTKSKKEDKGIALLAATDKITVDGQELEVIDMTGLTTDKVDADKKTMALAKTFRFSDSTVLFNGNVPADETKEGLEVVSKWASLCADDNDHVFETTDLLVVDNTRVRYCLVATDTYKSEANNLGVLASSVFKRNADDEKVYFATLFVDGEEVEYELDLLDDTDFDAVENGDFVSFTLSDEKITVIAPVVKTADVAEIELDDPITDGLLANADLTDCLEYKKSQFQVAEVDEGYVYYTEKVLNPSFDATQAESESNKKHLDPITELVIDEDGYVIYDLRDGNWEMFEGNIEDIEGLYVVAYEAEADTDTDVDIIVIFE